MCLCVLAKFLGLSVGALVCSLQVSQERILKEVDNKLKALKKRVCSSPTVGLSFWHSVRVFLAATHFLVSAHL